VRLRVALTDACHGAPVAGPRQTFAVRDEHAAEVGLLETAPGHPAEITLSSPATAPGPFTVTAADGRVWGRSNPTISLDAAPAQLFWGDLHAQSEYHVMHSQKKDARQSDWSKGISCGKPDDVYQYARDVSLLDFVAITDQGAITGVGWDVLQQKAAEYNRRGRFVTFNAYEAGAPVGHRNVYYRGEQVDPAQKSAEFSFMPEFLYKFYRGRRDVMMIPHHVKTWTDWSFHDPALEPIMEVYSCWGQSENPSRERWDKGMTPGAGAWEALRRGYRMGMIASSDNHVGMPGRSYPHDRQVHTPFPGGLAAVWAPELSREAIFDALRDRRCYGTTGARIILQFRLNDATMGQETSVSNPAAARRIQVNVRGTEAIVAVEILRNGAVVHAFEPGLRRATDVVALAWEDTSPLAGAAYYYARLRQSDGEMAWSSPVWVDLPR
jgi:hypothetical protein